MVTKAQKGGGYDPHGTSNHECSAGRSPVQVVKLCKHSSLSDKANSREVAGANLIVGVESPGIKVRAEHRGNGDVAKLLPQQMTNSVQIKNRVPTLGLASAAGSDANGCPLPRAIERTVSRVPAGGSTPLPRADECLIKDIMISGGAPDQHIDTETIGLLRAPTERCLESGAVDHEFDFEHRGTNATMTMYENTLISLGLISPVVPARLHQWTNRRCGNSSQHAGTGTAPTHGVNSHLQTVSLDDANTAKKRAAENFPESARKATAGMVQSPCFAATFVNNPENTSEDEFDCVLGVPAHDLGQDCASIVEGSGAHNGGANDHRFIPGGNEIPRQGLSTRNRRTKDSTFRKLGTKVLSKLYKGCLCGSDVQELDDLNTPSGDEDGIRLVSEVVATFQHSDGSGACSIVMRTKSACSGGRANRT